MKKFFGTSGPGIPRSPIAMIAIQNLPLFSGNQAEVTTYTLKVCGVICAAGEAAVPTHPARFSRCGAAIKGESTRIP
ncbi:hypothetical protein R1flu_012739 [Riccia fluitans]|uniref:Uncharacterized protein n=1 Tax=Riccia fluitans TaxID=41844 RepID=A0ABD1ZFK2_9MARC